MSEMINHVFNLYIKSRIDANIHPCIFIYIYIYVKLQTQFLLPLNIIRKDHSNESFKIPVLLSSFYWYGIRATEVGSSYTVKKNYHS